MKVVYLGLGSNQGDRLATLQRALDELSARQVHINRVSPVYETEPQGLRGQQWFLNAVAEAHTCLFPMQLLARIRRIELLLHRRRTIPNGPRTVDIDIVFFGNAVVNTHALQIPHPRYASRRFVIAPLVDLAPDLRDPVINRTMRELLAAVEGQAIRRYRHHLTITRK